MDILSFSNGSQFMFVLTFCLLLILSRVSYIDSDQDVNSHIDLQLYDTDFEMNFPNFDVTFDVNFDMNFEMGIANSIQALTENSVPPHWQCGASPLQLAGTYYWVNTVAADVAEEINSCCVVHDGDYDMCYERSVVDMKFGQCLTDACSKSNSWSDGCVHLVASMFSQIVQAYGEEAHQRACRVKEMSNSSTMTVVREASSTESVRPLYQSA
jgi:hypothetical protein